LQGFLQFLIGLNQLFFPLGKPLKMRGQRIQRLFEFRNERFSVRNLDENTTKLSVKSQTFGLGLDGSNGSFQFLDLSADAADLLAGSLNLCDHELELIDVFQRLTEPKGEAVVQECFPNTFSTLSVAMRPRSRVFHIALRSLQAPSSR